MKRHRNQLVLALCGFVFKEFGDMTGPHVIGAITQLFGVRVGFVSCGTFALMCLFPLVKKRTLRNAKALLL